MNFWEALILGIVQGITEFLPISSSGHLVLGETALGLQVADLADFDVTVHVGTLVAIFIYFRADFARLFRAFFTGKWRSPEGKLIGQLVIGTVPAVLVGLIWGDQILAFFRNPQLVGGMMIVVAAYFMLAEILRRTKPELTWGKALIVGLSQALAIIPGVSRSGSTIATAMLCGMERVEAARFSFLLGSIAIAGAGLLVGLDVAENGSTLSWGPLAVGFSASVISSYLAVSFLMEFFKKNTLKPFAYYLFAVGGLALVLTKLHIFT